MRRIGGICPEREHGRCSSFGLGNTSVTRRLAAAPGARRRVESNIQLPSLISSEAVYLRFLAVASGMASKPCYGCVVARVGCSKALPLCQRCETLGLPCCWRPGSLDEAIAAGNPGAATARVVESKEFNKIQASAPKKRPKKACDLCSSLKQKW